MADGSMDFGSRPSPDELVGYPLNHLGDAMRLIRLAGGVITDSGRVDSRSCTLLYQIGAGWVGFNGTHWDRTYGGELARRMAHKVADVMSGLQKELCEKWSLLKITDIVSYLRSCGSSGNTTGMLRQAQSYLTVEIDAFDQDKMAINCLNGTLKLFMRDGKLVRDLREHDPADRITKVTAVAYNEKAKAEEFRGVHRDSFVSRPDEGAYFQRCSGYGVSGLTREQAFFVLQGKGRDGKSTLTDAIRECMGSYGETGDVKTFLEGGQQNAAGPTPDLARLAGEVRYVVLSEPKKGAVWDEARLKAWTSGAPVPARDLNEKGMKFKPIGKLFTECNIFPRPKGDDDGFWRRIKVILFRHQVDPGKVDLDLPERIRRNELAGVLNWLLDGLEDYLQRGMQPPKALVDFVNNYRRSSSPLSEWLDDSCIWGDAAEGQWTSATELYGHFKEWWEAQGHETQKVPSQRTFGDFLGDRQIGWKKDRVGKKVRGPIRMKTIDERERDQMAAAGPAVPGEVEARPSSGGSSGGDALPPGDYYAEPGAFEPDEGDLGGDGQ